MRRLLVLLLATSGCFELPDEYRIEDLRIVEVRAEPPEIPFFRNAPIGGMAEEVFGSDLANEDIRMSVLAAHPDLDAEYRYAWFRCARENEEEERVGGYGRVPCEPEDDEVEAPLLADSERKRLEYETEPTYDFSPVDLLVNDLLNSGSDQVGFVGSLAEDPRDLFSGLRLNFHVRTEVTNANVEVDTPSLDGRKRVVLFDPAIVALVLQAARDGELGAVPMVQGVDIPSLCTNVSAGQYGTLLRYLQTRVPNQSPDYLELELTREGATSTVAYDPRQGSIKLAAGESILLAGRVSDESFETYRVIDDNCELVELDETMAWSWFVVDGDLSDHITSLEAERRDFSGYATRYTAPTDFEGDKLRTRIYSVLRDGRGGSDSLVIEVDVER
ncbi:MAG: hypothetical protein RIT81_12615 [Deltaproteobacteria bacterium]